MNTPGLFWQLDSFTKGGRQAQESQQVETSGGSGSVLVNGTGFDGSWPQVGHKTKWVRIVYLQPGDGIHRPSFSLRQTGVWPGLCALHYPSRNWLPTPTMGINCHPGRDLPNSCDRQEIPIVVKPGNFVFTAVGHP